jgi:hypothetical protein
MSLSLCCDGVVFAVKCYVLSVITTNTHITTHKTLDNHAEVSAKISCVGVMNFLCQKEEEAKSFLSSSSSGIIRLRVENVEFSAHEQ